MNWADYAIIAIITISLLISLMRGFAKEALSLGGWIVSFWVAIQFSGNMQGLLADQIETPSLRLLVAFVSLLIMGLFVTGIVNVLVGQVIKKTGLSGTDRVVGIIFGVARGVIVVAALVIIASMTPFPEDPWWGESKLLPHFEQIAAQIQQYLPEDIMTKFEKSTETLEMIQQHQQ